MNVFTLSKKVQMILLTLLVVVIGIIITGIYSNDKVIAGLENNGTCTDCGQLTTLRQNGESGHGYWCSICGTWARMFEHNYSEETEWIDCEDGKHHYGRYKCKDCTYIFEDKDHLTEHNWKKPKSKTISKHTYTCSDCDAKIEKNHMLITYWFNTTEHKTKCIACDYTSTYKHSIEGTNICEVCEKIGDNCKCGGIRYSRILDDDNHIQLCTGKCGYEKKEKHNYANKICTSCGFLDINTGNTFYNNCSKCGDGTTIISKIDACHHLIKCIACGEISTANHTFKSGKCIMCAFIKGSSDTGEEKEKLKHQYKENFIDYVSTGGGWHDYYKLCTVCDKRVRQGAEKCNGEGTDGKCTCCTDTEKIACTHKVTERVCYALEGDYHIYYDVCKHSKCGYKKYLWDEPCSDSDGNGECNLCKEVDAGCEGGNEEGTNSNIGNTECEHKYEKYTINQEGTHSSKCTKCEYELKNEAHKYENGKCVCGAENAVIEEKLEVTSEKYTIKDAYIAKIPSKATVSQFKANIQENAIEIKIYTKNGVLVEGENTKLATGMKIEFKKSNETKVYNIVVTGDVNGDAEVDLKDFLEINKHRLNKANLTNEFLIAGDVNFDGKDDLKDILQINKFRLGKINEL